MVGVAPTEAARILLVDDDEDDYEVTRGVLGQIRSFRSALRWERTYDSGLAALRERQSDVCLLDYRLGARDGLELLAAARGSGCTVPIIFLTGKGERSTDDLAMSQGADDFLGKADLTAASLERSVRYALERARHVEELRRSEQRYRRIVETTLEGVVATGVNGRMTFLNSQLATMLGYGRDELLGRRLAEFMNERACTGSGANVERRPRSGNRDEDVLFKRKDGSDLWTWLRTQRLFDSGGAYEGDLVMVTDVTERRRAEEVLRSTEEQLRQAQKMEAIGSLAGGIAHDFNNLLSVIISYADLVGSELNADDPSREDLREVGRAGRRAAELTAQLLAFGRKQVLQPRVVDLPHLLSGAEKMLRRVLRENIQLTIVPGSSALVFVDPGQVEQILLNLTINAGDAMPDGGTLTIETSDVRVSDDYAAEHVGVTAGPHVLLAVTDTGVGIPTDTQARVFEPFFTTKPVGKGTGLGLATVFGIVKQSGGHIGLHSEPGKGTTFKIFFPESVVGLGPEASVPPSDLPTTGGTETVLLVEDDELVRHLARNILRRRGYTVLEAANAGEALLICEQFSAKIDLLLTDVVMPHMGGREVVERLLQVRPALKVLYMSGSSDGTIAHRGVLEPGLHFLQKPLTPRALTAKVREALDAAD